ncbi:protein Wnt-16 isoform X1 [Ahaetulla prasina]|uniref:protein Wnt-16 isoform X1 n=1 Tax=Ahaetulla prasina TaxID=499056 RepID=UPI002649D804|nr:protein Wnt-16 isoform X1 [Ahaetulla prasina]
MHKQPQPIRAMLHIHEFSLANETASTKNTHPEAERNKETPVGETFLSPSSEALERLMGFSWRLTRCARVRPASARGEEGAAASAGSRCPHLCLAASERAGGGGKSFDCPRSSMRWLWRKGRPWDCLACACCGLRCCGKSAAAAPTPTGCTKETAFIYAVMAAGLVHSMTHLCSTGNLTDCACDSMLQNSGSAREGWHWGGCSDDIQYGMWLSRKFLDGPTKNISRKDRNGLMVMNLHNNEAGRLAVAKLMSIDCRCHGVSGSCALKTCWRTMSPFAKVGSFLKEKYENSIQISDRLRRKIRRKEKSQRSIPIQKEDLLYINRSPNYCMEDRKLGVSGTQGRECNRTSVGPDGCNLLCCGRGYNTQVVRHVERCECKFVWCCYVHCRRCETVTDVHTCK